MGRASGMDAVPWVLTWIANPEFGLLDLIWLVAGVAPVLDPGRDV